MNAEKILELKDVNKTFEKGGKPFQVLENLNLEIKKGKFLVVVGPSDCGKTTLLRLMAGFEEPTGGELLFESRPIRGPDPKRGFIFQDMILFPWLTVYENVAFGLRSREMKEEKIEESTRSWLSEVGLGRFHNKYVHELSGGMQQRVGLARVLNNDPEVLLCDEPLGNLDWVSRESLADLFSRLWFETKKTIVYTTHALEEAVFLAQEVYVMSKRPSKIVKVIKVNLPKTRWKEKGLRFRGDYLKIVESVRRVVKKEAGG